MGTIQPILFQQVSLLSILRTYPLCDAYRRNTRSRGGTIVPKYSMSARNYYIGLLLMAAFSIWIRAGFPVYAIAYAIHDDQLVIRMARYLEAGQWLGPYDSLTLAKG